MKSKKIRILIYMFAIVWGISTIFPLFITVLSSFKDNIEINLGLLNLPKKILYENYAVAFNNAHIGRAIFNSVLLASFSTVLTILIGMLAAYVLSRKRFKLRAPIYGLFIIGVMIPVHCTIIPISNISTRIGGKNSYWFIILVYVAFNLAQAIFLFTGYLNTIDKELDEAAIIDGCNDFQLFSKVLMPISVPIIFTEGILAFISGYGELIFALILLTNEEKYTVSRAMLSFQGGYQEQLGPLFACIIIGVIPMVTIYIIFHEKIHSGIMSGAIKG